MATVKVTTYPPEVLVGGAAPGESTARDEVRVAYAVRPGVSERQRLLARITALAKAIEHIALGINADDLGDDVFIGRTPDLMRALGLAMGTQKDIGDGRVLDES